MDKNKLIRLKLNIFLINLAIPLFFGVAREIYTQLYNPHNSRTVVQRILVGLKWDQIVLVLAFAVIAWLVILRILKPLFTFLERGEGREKAIRSIEPISLARRDDLFLRALPFPFAGGDPVFLVLADGGIDGFPGRYRHCLGDERPPGKKQIGVGNIFHGRSAERPFFTPQGLPHSRGDAPLLLALVSLRRRVLPRGKLGRRDGAREFARRPDLHRRGVPFRHILPDSSFANRIPRATQVAQAQRGEPREIGRQHHAAPAYFEHRRDRRGDRGGQFLPRFAFRNGFQYLRVSRRDSHGRDGPRRFGRLERWGPQGF
jgi:hypothetical protein